MSEYEMSCPIVWCAEPILLDWHATFTLGPRDLDDDYLTKCGPADGHTRSWEICCAAGHTLALPVDTGADYYDLTPEDLARLRRTLEALRAAAQLEPDNAT